jgi:signal transduction histidine kinase
MTVEVRDHGRGIPAKTRSNLFRPFYRAPQAGHHLPGLGLGLALCKEIVTAHGGRMWLDSKEGKGTVVGFAVPDHRTEDEQASGLGEGR